MKKIKLLLLAFVALIAATSCTIEQTVNYNADMSGTNQVIVDYGGLLDQMGDMLGDSESLMKNKDMEKGLGDLEEIFKDLPGVSNMQLITETDDNKLGFAFSFEDTKALNNAMQDYMESSSGDKKKKAAKTYVQKGKKLLLNFDNQDMSSVEESLGDPSMLGMMGMFDYKFTVNLPNAVKSVDNKNYTLSEDRKSLSTTVNLKDYLNGDESLSAKIKW